MSRGEWKGRPGRAQTRGRGSSPGRLVGPVPPVIDPVPLHETGYPLRQRGRGLVARQPLEPARIRPGRQNVALLHRQELLFRLLPESIFDLADELHQRIGGGLADVDQPVGRHGAQAVTLRHRPVPGSFRHRVEQPDDCLDEVVDEHEIPPHLAVVENPDRPAFKDRLREEVIGHVRPPPWPVDREEPEHRDRNVEDVAVRMGENLGRPLRRGIGRKRPVRPHRLGVGHLPVRAVGRGGRGEERVAHRRLPERFEKLECAENIRLDVAARILDRGAYASLGGEVHDDLGFVPGDGRLQQSGRLDASAEMDVAGVVLEPCATGGLQCRIVGFGLAIDAHDPPALRHQPAGEVEPDEPGAASYEGCWHWAIPHPVQGVIGAAEAPRKHGARPIVSAACAKGVRRGRAMKIAMIGTGYVGLVSGVCFSDFGHHVVCVDKDQRKIDMLERGEVPIFEPGLDVLMSKNVEAGRLRFTADLQAAIEGAEAVFIAVGTPTRRGDGHADLTYVMAAAEGIAKACKDYVVIVTKSTVPVGTNRKVWEVVAAANPDLDFDVSSNPEFLREGAAIDDFMKPDRVIVGVETERAAAVMSDIYRPLYLRDFPVVTTDLESAEMIKYAANAFLATKITFINEIAALCERTGADVKKVSQGMGLDGRIGNKFLHAGPGYGGSCFPKDTSALARIGQEHGAPMYLTEAVIKVNDGVKRRMIDKIVDLCGGS